MAINQHEVEDGHQFPSADGVSDQNRAGLRPTGAGAAPARAFALGPKRGPVRVCMVSSEFLGPHRNGGIGTAYTRLGEVLNDAGHDVTFLYTMGQYTLTEPIDHWVEFYRQRGIRFVPLPDAPVPLASVSHFLQASFRVYQWFLEHDEFDVVHFQEYLAVGHHALIAQHQGRVLQNAITIVGLHSSHEWLRAANGQLACTAEDLENDFVERRSGELADIVWSPGRYMLDWARAHGWRLDQTSHVQPYVVPSCPVRTEANAPPRPVREIVFFGRQEVRKGLLLFLDAIDRLAASGQTGAFPGLSVTFLGRTTAINGKDSEQLIHERIQRWPFPARVFSHHGHDEAIAYLQGEGRLIVVPSLDENFPNTVLECLALGAPVLASASGGIPELFHPEDLERACFEPTPRRLAERLERALRDGHGPSRLSFGPDQNRRDWTSWHEGLVDGTISVPRRERRAEAAHSQTYGQKAPTISVCVVREDGPERPPLDVLGSLQAQEEAPLEVIVVDIGARAEPPAERNGWRSLRVEGLSAGEARQRAAEEARGEFVLFLDERDHARPEMIARLKQAARHTGADLFTGAIDVVQDGDTIESGLTTSFRWLGSGSNHPLSFWDDRVSGAYLMVRRAVFQGAGGFNLERAPAHQRRELLARLTIEGRIHEVLPDALAWRRGEAGPEAASRSNVTPRDHRNLVRPHLDRIPEPYRPLVELCIGRSLQRAGRLDAARRDNLTWAWGLEPPPPPPPMVPLRYRVVDALNGRLRRFSRLHRAGKASLRALLQARRDLRARWAERPRTAGPDRTKSAA